MPYDPTLPQAGTEIDADQMRAQLNGLKALIDAIQTLTAAQVDGVLTLPPGEPALVSVSVTGNTLHFSFSIPQGFPGEPGPPGEVTEQQLTDAIATRAHNISGITPLDLTPDPDYNPSQLGDLVYKVNEMITTLGQE